MSVIAKLHITECTKYGDRWAVALNVVAESELMAECGGAKDDEDILFTKASPSGSSRLNFQNLPGEVGDKFYFIFCKGEKPNIDGSVGYAKMRCYGITDYGGTSRQVELMCNWAYDRKFTDSIELFNANFKILIDNPGAFEQFKAGEEGWWMTIYPTSKFTMSQALAKAHSFHDQEEQADVTTEA